MQRAGGGRTLWKNVAWMKWAQRHSCHPFFKGFIFSIFKVWAYVWVGLLQKCRSRKARKGHCIPWVWNHRLFCKLPEVGAENYPWILHKGIIRPLLVPGPSLQPWVYHLMNMKKLTYIQWTCSRMHPSPHGTVRLSCMNDYLWPSQMKALCSSEETPPW